MGLSRRAARLAVAYRKCSKQFARRDGGGGLRQNNQPNAMLRDLRYLFAYTLPLSTVLALTMQGYWSYATVLYAFGVIPILDQVLGQQRANESGEESGERVLVQRFFDVLLYLNVPILWGCVGYFVVLVAGGGLATYELVGLVLSVGILSGSLGINVAHELGHRVRKFEQVLAQALLLPSLYTHFFVEHNRGHHKHVATPLDPATSRRGELIYAFWVRSVVGSYRNAWRLEATRLGRDGRGALTLDNQMVQFTLVQAALLVAIGATFGAVALAAFVAQAVVGFLLLESVNYVEHYGLLRKQLPSGRYEPVTPRHSWNSEHEIGRIVLYELTRHADHHYKANRPFQQLRWLPESPELPAGYPASILMALVPPVWFSVMDKRVPV